MSHFSNRLEDFEPIELPEGVPADYSTYDLFADLIRKVGRCGQKTAQGMDLLREDLGSAYETLRANAEKIRLNANHLESELKSLEIGLLDFMDIIDNLQRVTKSIEDRAFIDSVGVAHKAKEQILARLGIQLIPCIGARYDNEVHFIANTRPVEQLGMDNTVVDVIENGYRRGNRLLRKATIVCGKYKGE